MLFENEVLIRIYVVVTNNFGLTLLTQTMQKTMLFFYTEGAVGHTLPRIRFFLDWPKMRVGACIVRTAAKTYSSSRSMYDMRRQDFVFCFVPLTADFPN